MIGHRSYVHNLDSCESKEKVRGACLAEGYKSFSSVLKLINSLSLNNGNHDRDVVWVSDLNWHRF